jgi:hypothetical protein
MRSGWSLPASRRPSTRHRLRQLGPLRHARHALVDDAVSLQRRLQDLAGAGVVVFELEMIHDARVIFTTAGRRCRRRTGLHGRVARPLGGNTLVVETTNYRGGLAPMINLAVVGSPRATAFPQSDQMKTTERITRLNNEMWLYEIKTEDPVILTRPVHGPLPMRHDPKYEWWEYACHEGNTIVPNYVTTSRFERANPSPKRRLPVKVDAPIADALAGRWVGRPRIATIDYDIELEFTKTADGAIAGKLVGTTLPKEEKIDKPLKRFTVQDRR